MQRGLFLPAGICLALAAIEKSILAPFEQNSKGEQQDISHMVGEYWAIAVEGYIMDREGFKDLHETRAWILRTTRICTN